MVKVKVEMPSSTSSSTKPHLASRLEEGVSMYKVRRTEYHGIQSTDRGRRIKIDAATGICRSISVQRTANESEENSMNAAECHIAPASTRPNQFSPVQSEMVTGTETRKQPVDMLTREKRRGWEGGLGGVY